MWLRRDRPRTMKEATDLATTAESILKEDRTTRRNRVRAADTSMADELAKLKLALAQMSSKWDSKTATAVAKPETPSSAKKHRRGSRGGANSTKSPEEYVPRDATEDDKCFQCEKMGHFAKNCPERRHNRGESGASATKAESHPSAEASQEN